MTAPRYKRFTEWLRETVIRLYAVPPEILGVPCNSNRATVETCRRIYQNQCPTSTPKLKGIIE